MTQTMVTLDSTITLGKTGPRTAPLGLGCMAFSGMYGTKDENAGIATIHAALDRGITLFDTGDFYGMGHNESLLGQALKGRRDRALISVKFGALRDPDGGWHGSDARPVAIKNFVTYSLQRLGVEVIDIYRPARLDPNVPIEDTIGAIAELIQAGYVRFIGLSEVGESTIRRAHAVHPIADLQIEYSLASRGPEQTIFPLLHELGIGATLYGVLSRGLLSGGRPKGPKDFRSYLPRFTGNSEQNNTLVAQFHAFANERGATPVQVAFAWVRAKQPGFLALIGAKTPEQLNDSLGSIALTLSPKDIETLDTLFHPNAIEGPRYPVSQMQALDSERKP